MGFGGLLKRKALDDVRLERPGLDKPLELLDDLTLGNAVVPGNFHPEAALGPDSISLG